MSLGKKTKRIKTKQTNKKPRTQQNSLVGQELCTQCFLSEAVSDAGRDCGCSGPTGLTHRAWQCRCPVFCSHHCWSKPISSLLQLYLFFPVLGLLSHMISIIFVRSVYLDLETLLLFRVSRPALWTPAWMCIRFTPS